VTVEEACQSAAHDLPPNVHVAHHRIAQEAPSNVVKHAQASHVDVRLHFDSVPQGAHVELCIRDDGLGFDPGTVAQNRLGLGFMHERADSINARLEVESQPARGTQVRVVWAAGGGESDG
jgi:two-component system sensor histidine kinase DegS